MAGHPAGASAAFKKSFVWRYFIHRRLIEIQYIYFTESRRHSEFLEAITISSDKKTLLPSNMKLNPTERDKVPENSHLYKINLYGTYLHTFL